MSSSPKEMGGYIVCPEPTCNEPILPIQLNEHRSIHLAEKLTFGDRYTKESEARKKADSALKTPTIHGGDSPISPLPGGRRRHRHETRQVKSPSPTRKPASGLAALRKKFSGHKSPPIPESPKIANYSGGRKRLGKTQLGPYAFEERMPDWLFELLRRGGKKKYTNQIGRDGKIKETVHISNETTETMLVISRLCQLDPGVTQALFCHPGVIHVSRIRHEGSFCGYRNIQMMISYIQSAECPGHEHFPGGIPGVLDIQEFIEDAWNNGINSWSRVETGGIRGTRKFIGTPEAQAVFLNFGIACEILAFIDTPEVRAYVRVLDIVEEYFRSGCQDVDGKICKSWLPPLYFQFPGHSLTIVGYERRKHSRNLIVFDPGFQPIKGVRDRAGRADFDHKHPDKALALYRKSESFLAKYDKFEILQLTIAVEQAGGKVWAKLRKPAEAAQPAQPSESE